MSKTAQIEHALRLLNAAFASGAIDEAAYIRDDARLRARQAEIRAWREGQGRVGQRLPYTGRVGQAAPAPPPASLLTVHSEPAPILVNSKMPAPPPATLVLNTSEPPAPPPAGKLLETETFPAPPSSNRLKITPPPATRPRTRAGAIAPPPAKSSTSCGRFPAPPPATKSANGTLDQPRLRRVTLEGHRRITLRRRVAASGMIPHQLAGHFTLGEQAVLTAIAYEVMRHGACALPWKHLGDRAGCSRDLVRRTVHKAAVLGLLDLQERPRQAYGWKHLPTVVRVVDGLWMRWLAKRKAAEGRKAVVHNNGLPGGRNRPTPDNGKICAALASHYRLAIVTFSESRRAGRVRRRRK